MGIQTALVTCRFILMNDTLVRNGVDHWNSNIESSNRSFTITGSNSLQNVFDLSTQTGTQVTIMHAVFLALAYTFFG